MKPVRRVVYPLLAMLLVVLSLVAARPAGAQTKAPLATRASRVAPSKELGSASAAKTVSAAASVANAGYWLAAADGGIFAFGDGAFHGSAGAQHLNSSVVATASTPSGNGYWLVESDGEVFAFGDAVVYGSLLGQHLNNPIVGLASTPSGHGYWLVASDGGIFAFGDAAFHGSTGGQHLNKPIVGMASSASGHGYWLVASDGGIFAYGDATFDGSTGGQHLNQPIVGMASSGAGYWLVASDGGIFTFGNAAFDGSTGGQHLNQPIVGMAATPTGKGYWLVASDGGIFTFGNAAFHGSTGGEHLNSPIVAMSSVSGTHAGPVPPPPPAPPVVPAVSSITPSTGPAAGGTAVTIRGSGFAAATTVTFGARLSTHVVVESTTTLVATSPAGTGIVNVTATTSGRTSPVSGADRFTYVSVPVGTVSGPPTDLSATPAAGTPASGSATVDFSAPIVTGGTPIVSYTVTATPGGETATGAASPLTVTGLTNGTSYTFTVRATNGVGASNPSLPSNAVIPTTVPAAPTGVAAAVPLENQAVVSFSAPTLTGGSPVTSYTVTSTPGGFTASGAGSPLTVTGLTDASPYTFSVHATNVRGDSVESTRSSPVTPFTNPGTPTVPVATAGDSSASVAFSAPVFTGGSPVTGYTVTSTPGGFTNSGDGSPIDVVGLTNGTAYTFTVHATNLRGDGSESAPSVPVTPAAVPGAPAAPTVTAGDGSAVVAFSAPTVSGGSPITSYTVTSSPGGFTATGGATPLLVTGLVDGTSYTFSVTATNAIGTGPASSPSPSAIPSGVPGGFTAAPVVTAGDGQASVAFTSAASNGSPVTSYTVTALPGFFTVSGAASPLVITGLTNGTSYVFVVHATNAVGVGPESPPSSSVTPAGVPGPPTLPVAAPGNLEASVAFVAPANNDGSVVTGYTVTSTPDGLTGTGAHSPIIVSGLTNGTAYTFTVHATNAVGDSVESAPSAAVTPADFPGPPTDAVATASDSSASVAFSAPVDTGGGPITSYTVTSSPGGLTNTGVGSPIVVTGLTNGTAYTFTVHATNVVGSSLESDPPTLAVTPVAVPSAPTAVVATPANGQVTVAFSPPATDGGSTITGYEVTTTPGGATAGTTSPITVTGLTNGTLYTFSVHAINGVGSSVESSSVSATPLQTVPDAPTGATVIGGNASATVSFDAPANNGGSSITSYLVTSSPGDFTATGSGSPLTVTGLTNGTSYTFTVHATNATPGHSGESTPTESVIPATVPDVPTDVSATTGDGQASVAFDAPAFDGGHDITSYTVTSSPGGLTNTGDTSPITVSGLSNGTPYTFTVTATNDVGDSASSAPSSASTPVTVPDAPSSVVATPADGQASVAFDVPDTDGGTTITGYTVTSSPGGLTATGTGSPIVVPGLDDGVSYTFTVVATNSVGDGSASDPSSSVTPATTPDAPTNVVATGGIASASVAFDAPASDGGSPVTLYTVISSPAGALTNTGSTSPINVTGLTNGVSYTFTVVATNSVGDSSASDPSAAVLLGLPDAPTSLSASGGNAQATISFDPPGSDGGSPITNYTVTSNPGGLVSSRSSSPITVGGLTNGTSYTFTVDATNAAGASAESTVSNAVIPATVPDPPTAIVATFGDSSASVAFDSPGVDGGNAITGYTVTSTPGGVVASGSASPIVVSGLTNGTSYTFTVHATNGVGDSVESGASTSVTVGAVPGAPTAVVASPTNTGASVAFVAPVDNGGNAITNYTVTSDPGGLTGTGSASPVIVSGLTNGTSYTFTVVATNVVGDGPASDPSAAVTPATVPSAPTNATVVGGNGQATVTFDASTDTGGSPITSYTVTSTPGGLTQSGSGSPITVTGLANGTSYTFAVQATNTAGNSLASAPTTAVTPATVPGVPTAVVATGSNASASVAFSAPVATGGNAITGYTVTSTPGGFTSTGATSPILVTGLANGTAYTFTVHATNGVGDSTESVPSGSVTPAPIAPGAPTGVSAVSNNAQATVSFSAPLSDGGSTITGYRVISIPGGHTTTGSASPLTVGTLTNGTAYTFTVHAINAVGNSVESSPSNSVIPATVPGVPTAVVATGSNGSASVSFTAPAVTGGNAITGYKVTSSPGGFTSTGATSPIVVTGLTNGTAYTFTVHATNGVGDGAESVPSGSVTPAPIVSGAPTSVVATRGNAQVSVAFTAPLSNGGATITGYTVTSTPGGFTNSGATSPIVVTGLTNGTSYTFTVHATNVAGASPESPPSSPVTPATVAGAPTAVVATGANASASVAFSAPTVTGGSTITGYTVTSTPGGLTNTGTTSPIVVTGLTNGTAYTFTVHATNAVGDSAESTPSVAVTPSAASAPSAPTGVTAYDEGCDGYAFLEWTAGATHGSTITSYTATASPGGLTGTSPGASTFLDVANLTLGQTYTFTVHANSSLGASPESLTTNPITITDDFC